MTQGGNVVTTDFAMRDSMWRSFGPFAIQNSLTQVEIESGSRIDARSDFRIGGATATIGSTSETPSRIDVAGNFDPEGTLPGSLTIEDGGVVDVDGTLTIGQLGTLNLNEGGTLRVGYLVFEQDGVLNENGATLVVPRRVASSPRSRPRWRSRFCVGGGTSSAPRPTRCPQRASSVPPLARQPGMVG